jgi:hypothetical protein
MIFKAYRNEELKEEFTKKFSMPSTNKVSESNNRGTKHSQVWGITVAKSQLKQNVKKANPKCPSFTLEPLTK